MVRSRFAFCIAAYAFALLFLPVGLSVADEGVELRKLREELAELKLQNADLTRRIVEIESKLASATKVTDDRTAEDHEKSPTKCTGGTYALDGYCAVSLQRDSCWKLGRLTHRIDYRGLVYLFAGLEEEKAFAANPEKYALLLEGNDPVTWIEERKRVPGALRHGICYGQHVLLFSSEDNLHKFLVNRSKYGEPILELASAGINGSMSVAASEGEPAAAEAASDPPSSRSRPGRRGRRWRRSRAYR